MARHEIRVKVGQKDVTNPEAIFLGVGQVLLDVALGVDDDGGGAGLVCEEIGSVREAAQVVLFKNHSNSRSSAGTRITSSPFFQFTGVATLCSAVSCIESRTRRISSKFRPVVIGYASISLILLSGPTMKTVRTVALLAAVRPSHVSPASAGSML